MHLYIFRLRDSLVQFANNMLENLEYFEFKSARQINIAQFIMRPIPGAGFFFLFLQFIHEMYGSENSTSNFFPTLLNAQHKDEIYFSVRGCHGKYIPQRVN